MEKLTERSKHMEQGYMEMLNQKMQFCNLPEQVKQEIIKYLRYNDFVKAKQVFDMHNQEKRI